MVLQVRVPPDPGVEADDGLLGPAGELVAAPDPETPEAELAPEPGVVLVGAVDPADPGDPEPQPARRSRAEAVMAM